MSPLPKYSLSLFRDKVAIIPGVDESDLNLINVWWQKVDSKTAWVARFKAAVKCLPKGTPETVDARAAFRGCDIYFRDVNDSLASLLRLPDDNFVMKIWIRPALSIIGKFGLRRTLFDETAKLIRDFQSRYETVENDQVIAICEAMVECGGSQANAVRLKVAQWGFEEVFRLFKMLELKVKVGGVDELTTVDDLGAEKLELEEAIHTEPWSSEKREYFRRIFNRMRKAMDQLQFETETKLAFNRAFDYATGHAGKTVSAIDILRTVEAVWQGIEADNTLQEFWESEQEKLDEELEK